MAAPRAYSRQSDQTEICVHLFLKPIGKDLRPRRPANRASRATLVQFAGSAFRPFCCFCFWALGHYQWPALDCMLRWENQASPYACATLTPTHTPKGELRPSQTDYHGTGLAESDSINSPCERARTPRSEVPNRRLDDLRISCSDWTNRSGPDLDQCQRACREPDGSHCGWSERPVQARGDSPS